MPFKQQMKVPCPILQPRNDYTDCMKCKGKQNKTVYKDLRNKQNENESNALWLLDCRGSWVD